MAAVIGCVFQRNDKMWAARYIHDGKRKHVYSLSETEAIQKRQAVVDKINQSEPPKADNKVSGANALYCDAECQPGENNGSAVNDENSGVLETDTLNAGAPEAGSPAPSVEVTGDNLAVTLGEWLTEWLEAYIKPCKSITTYTNYAALINGHVVPAMGKTRLQDLSLKTLQDFFNEKSVTGRQDGKPGGMSPQSLENLRFMLKASMDKAVEDGLIREHNFLRVEIRKVPRKEASVLSPEEEIKLAAACNESNNLSAFGIVIALKMGLCLGELLALKWSSIDSAGKQMSIHKAGGVYIKRDLSESFISDMESYRHKQERLIGGAPDTVIVSSVGKPVSPSNYNRIFKSVLDISGIAYAHFDILRYTFAIRCIENGHSLTEVQKLLGCGEKSKSLYKIKKIMKKQKIRYIG